MFTKYSDQKQHRMKSNWLLIVEQESISLNTRFYKISVGTTKQDDHDWAYINLYAAMNGFFFEKWSSQVADFVDNIAESLNSTILDLNIHHISARELVKYMVEHGEPPKKPFLTPSQIKIGHVLRPSSYFNRQINVIRHAEAKQRRKPKAHNDSDFGS